MTRVNVEKENCIFLSLKKPWLCLVWIIQQCFAFQCSVFINSICFCYSSFIKSQTFMDFVCWELNEWLFFLWNHPKSIMPCAQEIHQINWLNSIRLSYIGIIFVSFNAKMTSFMIQLIIQSIQLDKKH